MVLLGAVVEISATPFALVGADIATIESMEERCEDYAVSNLGAILPKLAGMRAALEAAPQAQLRDEELHRMAAEAGVELCLHEIVTLVRAFGQQDGASPRGYVEAAKLLAAL